MKRIIIYVEGISDKLVLEMLFSNLIEEKSRQQVFISIHEAPEGDKKKSVLLKVPIKAADILVQNPMDVVIALPDLYPLNHGFPHQNFSELEQGIRNNFLKRLEEKNIKDSDSINVRFKCFSFKYDMEVLILAVPEKIKSYLKVKSHKTKWIEPVENQNGHYPPKKVVQKIFEETGKKYNEKIDATGILASVHFEELSQRCTECFKPFVDYIKSI